MSKITRARLIGALSPALTVVAISFLICSIGTRVYAQTTSCQDGIPVNTTLVVHPKATISVSVTAPSGMQSELDVLLKNSSGDTIRTVKTCGNLNASSGSTVSLKTAFYDIDAGSYKVCISDVCKSVNITKPTGNTFANQSVSLSLAKSSVPNQYRTVRVNIKMDIEAPTVDTTYGPIPTVLINQDGNRSPISNTRSMSLSANDKVESLDFAVSYTPVLDGGYYQACIAGSSDTTLGKCSALGIKKSGENLELYINLDKTESSPYIVATESIGDDKTCGDVVTTGIGWIICPVLGTLTAVNGTMWAAVENLLTVSPLEQTSGGIYDGWKVIRDLANVVFVIAFLVIVFSQLTGAGITNYGVKKILPRLVVAAILVNISFVIIQVLVDAFNILGSGLYELIYKATPAVKVGWGSILGAFLGSGAAATAAAGGGIVAVAIVGGPEAAVWMLLPSAVIGLLSLLAAVFTLIFRQAVIPILAMVAPLAFVAYLLPNTEQWFKKWADLLMRMLMMYPLAALIFGGARFAGATIMGNATDGWKVIMGLIVMTLPLFSLPFLIKQGGAILSGLNSSLNKLAERARKPLSDYTGLRAEHAASNYRKQDSRYKKDKDGNIIGERNIFDRKLRESSRKHQARKEQLKWETKGNNDEFMDQVINNEVGATEGRSLSNPKGRPVDFRGSYDRARGASQNLALNDQESDARLHEHNPQFNGQLLKDREFSANARLEKAKANTDERIAQKEEFDGLRLDVDHAKSKAAAAQAKANTKVEQGTSSTGESTTQVRAAQNVADTQLKNAQAVTEQAIVEASTSVDSSSLSKAAQTIDSSTRTQLQNNTIEQVVVGSATTAATNQQKQEIADKLVNNTEGVATAAGGIGGAAATARVQATATSEQAAFRRTNVEAATALYTHQKYTTGDSGDLMTVITGGNNKDHTVPTSEQREAAMNIVFATRSKKSQAKIFDHIANMPNGAEKTAMQQAYDKLLNIDKPVSIGGGTRGKLSVGGQSNILENKGATTPFQDQIITTMKGGKLAAETWASMDKDEIEMYADTLGTEPAKDGHLAGLGSSVIDDDTRGVVADKIETALTDSIISASIKPEQKAQLNRILASLGRPEIA